jgi:hypothetical protein
VGGMNLWMGLFNLMPLRVRLGSYMLQSDGAQILTVLRTGAASSDPTSPLSALQTFRELWQAVGDKQMLYAHLIAVGDFWVSVGDAERGGELLAEARALSFEPLAAWRSYGILVEAEAALERDDTERAAVVLARAEEEFRLLGHEAGLLLARRAGAELLRRRGEAAAALAALDALAAHRLVRKRMSLRCLLLGQRVVCHCDLADGDPEPLLAEYASVPMPHRSLIADMETFQAAARWRLRRGEGERAAQAYERALTAVRGLDVRMAGADQERFRMVKAPVIAETQQCLRTLGRDEEAARLDAFFPTAEERSRRVREARERRASQSARWGAALLGFNFAVILLLATAASGGAFFAPNASRASPQTAGFFAMFLLVVLTISTGFGVLAGLVLGGLGRLIKEIKGLAGITVLLCGWAPWVMWLTAFALDVFLRAMTRSAP